MSAALIVRLRAALILARDFMQDEVSVLISSDTLADEKGEARRDTMSDLTRDAVEKIEADMKTVSEAIRDADEWLGKDNADAR